MSVVETTKAHVKNVVEMVTDVLGDPATDARTQAITVGVPRRDVIDLFQDANRLARAFGDVADVHRLSVDRLRWSFLLDGYDGADWDCVVIVEDDMRLRYVDVHPERDTGIVLDFRDAPQDRGTEVIAHVSTPAPGALTGAVVFKALYRARALLITGEVPTIDHNPSARGWYR
jgi:uncharacterized membrane protein